jgi:hypothetical protein
MYICTSATLLRGGYRGRAVEKRLDGLANFEFGADGML